MLYKMVASVYHNTNFENLPIILPIIIGYHVPKHELLHEIPIG